MIGRIFLGFGLVLGSSEALLFVFAFLFRHRLDCTAIVIGLVAHVVSVAEIGKLRGTSLWAGTGCENDFCVAFRAQSHRLAIGLLLVIASLHVAAIFLAVQNREHVSRFVRGQFQRSLKACLIRFFALGGIAKSVQRPNADSLPIGCVTEDKIPTITWPKIRIGHRDGGECVIRKPRDQNVLKDR